MPVVDPGPFWRRLSRLRDVFQSKNWSAIDALSVTADEGTDETSFNKSAAFFLHLFGCELPGSLLVYIEGAMHIAASHTNCTMLDSLQHQKPASMENVALVTHRISTDRDIEMVCKHLVNVIKHSRGGTKLGCLMKIKCSNLSNKWNASVDSACGSV